MTKTELRRVAALGGQVGAYARMALAVEAGKGCRLSYDECADVVTDTAISDAIEEAFADLEDGSSQRDAQ